MRWSNAQLLHFLEISCGSASELEFQCHIAGRLQYAPEGELQKLRRLAAEQHRMNLSYARWVRSSR
jgi:four helix bundle protein